MAEKAASNESQIALLNASSMHAKKQLAIMLSTQSYLFEAARPGYSRGTIFYKSMKNIHFILSRAIFNFFVHHKYMPSLINPKTFSEKILWSKLFREFKIPEAGNKLLTHKFIPESLNEKISVPPIIWHSKKPILPDNKDVAPGSYYLKSNHGSRMFKQISYPLAEQDKLEAEASARLWLDHKYGLNSGEWFYNCFQKEILLEKDIALEMDSLSWNYYMFNGTCALLSVVQKTIGGTKFTCYDKNFNHIAIPESKPLEKFSLDRTIALDLSILSQEIANTSNFVRVDFLIDQDGNPFLGELTWTPMDGFSMLPLKHEFELGESWKHF